MDRTVIRQKDITYEFGTDGFLRSAVMHGFNGAVYPVIARGGDFGRIRIRLSDGRELTPFCVIPPDRTETENAVILEFPEILWKTPDDVPFQGFRLSLRYELLSKGRAFVNAFFCAGDMQSPDLDDFSLKFDVASGDYPETKWAVVPRPRKSDASMIQAMRSGRFLDPGKNRRIDGEILPEVTLNVRSACGESAYMELFVEGENSISGDAGDCLTDLQWAENGDFRADFSFVRNKPCRNKLMQLWQWRNQWGWVLKTADKTRRKPPFHMYHYFDNYVRYPSDECLENLARSGTDVLIIHENWRFDLQNDGVPFQPHELRRVIAKAHSLGIRIALYVRGSEISALEGACPWFDRYLKKNYDGLYMDFGGPFSDVQVAPDESFPGGRLAFKKYVLRMEALRNRIGEEGIFYGHTGTSYSGVWYASGGIDGYVSGEGEGGVMVSSRQAHEYYSMATVSPGTMWTGAFPAYSSAKMRPFLAAAGQYPHSPLGEQFKTCSLAHPREPGVNDIAFRPIWKIWRIFRNERDMAVLNDYNCFGVFDRSPDVGHYMMISADRKRALLIVSNFSSSANHFTCTLDKPFTAESAFRLTPTEETPGKAVRVDPASSSFEFTLGPNDVGAVYFESDSAVAEKMLAEFETPYPELTPENRRYLEYLARQRALRYEMPAAKEIFMTLTVPNTNLSYEYSLCYDLYYNAMALVEFLPDGSKKRLGWISQKGFVADEPGPDDYIWPDVVSPKIPLHEILGRGEHFIGIESVHYGAPFYSFLSAELTADGGEPYTIYFMNELEPERQFLRWKVTID